MRTVSEMLKISMWKYFTVAFYVLKVAHLSGRADYRNLDDQYRSYKGHQLLRIYPSQPEDLEKLKLLEQDESRKIDFWQRPSSSKRNVDILVAPEDGEVVKELMRKNGLEVAVVSEDIQSLIDEELKQRSEHTWNKRSPPTKRLHKYLSFDSIMEWMEETAEKCQFCDMISIGKSSEGRDLKVLKITKSTDRKPAIFIDAGFHAREWIGPITALNFIDALINESDPVMNFLTQEYVWYVLPLANPDGYVYSWTTDRLWRKTRSKHDANGCVGADLNRNWDFFWGGEGTSRNSCRENFCGPKPFSEPEARALADFILDKSNDLIIYISLHSYGQLLLAPWGYTTQVPHDFYDLLIRGTEAAEAMRKSTGTKYAVGSTGRMLYLASGASDDWVKGVAKVKYSFTIELRDLGSRGFLLPESEIPDTALEATNGITKMSLDVLKELKRFGNKYSVVFKEDNFQDIFRKPEEKSGVDEELQSQRDRKVLENSLGADYGKHPKNKELARDDVEDQYKDDLRYDDTNDDEEEMKAAEEPMEKQEDLLKTRAYDDEKLKKSLEETMNLQKLRLRQIMKSFEDEIHKQNIWYKRKPKENSKDGKVKLKSRLQYLKKLVF